QDLAEDLRRFLAGEPIKARPAGLPERGWRWCRRKPWVASLLAALAVVTATALACVTVLWRQAETRRHEALDSAAEARRQQQDAASRLARAGYAQRLALFGEDHPETAASLHSLGRLAHVRGDYFEGERFYRRALKVRLALSPLPEREVADTEFNLGWLLAEM